MKIDSEEKLIELMESLPKHRIRFKNKDQVWFRIQSRVRSRQIAQNPLPRTSLWFGWNFSGLASSVLVVVLTFGMTVALTGAAGRSLPGETLYPVKKAVEKFEIVLASSDDKKAETLQQHARKRLKEIQTLVEEKKASNEIVAQSAQNLKTATEQAVKASENKPELIDKAIELATEEEKVLITVQEKVEGEAKEAVADALHATRQSISKLKGDESPGSVEGEITGVPEPASTTTAPVIPPSGKKTASPSAYPPKSSDAVIESNIQIDEVIRGNNTDDSPPPEPEVISEPNTSF